jgi:transcriptional regulator CtsR
MNAPIAFYHAFTPVLHEYSALICNFEIKKNKTASVFSVVPSKAKYVPSKVKIVDFFLSKKGSELRT